MCLRAGLDAGAGCTLVSRGAGLRVSMDAKYRNQGRRGQGYYLIDAVIAVSVIYKGFDNLDGFRRAIGIKPPNALAMVLGFGLIHGFGLVTAMSDGGYLVTWTRVSLPTAEFLNPER